MNTLEILVVITPLIALLDALITLYTNLRTLKNHDEQKSLIGDVANDVVVLTELSRRGDMSYQSHQGHDILPHIPVRETSRRSWSG